MTRDASPQSRPNYGIDAPEVVRRLFSLGILGICFGYATAFAVTHGHLISIRFMIVPLWSFGVAFLIQAFAMLWGSKVGKLRLRDRLIASIPWRGDEQVLDVGCGHGLLLIAAAKQLRTGKAVGIDIWQTEDQSANSPEATRQNILLENVADRIDLKDGDVRKLPFADNTFDVVLSSWCIHNIYDQAGRATAIREILRVLKPGGRLAIVDIRHVPEYAKILKENQMRDIRQSPPNFMFVIPSITLTATKPPRSPR
jgi:arsenite methyltransferase